MKNESPTIEELIDAIVFISGSSRQECEYHEDTRTFTVKTEYSILHHDDQGYDWEEEIPEVINISLEEAQAYYEEMNNSPSIHPVCPIWPTYSEEDELPF